MPKNPHAQALGSLGGKASQGGRKGMTEERKSELGRKAAKARWEKYRRETITCSYCGTTIKRESAHRGSGTGSLYCRDCKRRYDL